LTRRLLSLATLLAAGCSYTYKNPAEDLRAGEASGRVVADRQGVGALVPFPGVSVSLRGAAFDQMTRETGRFALLPLPTGRHTLLFRKGSLWALERDVEIAFGKDGQPEGVALGDVALLYGTTVVGSVVPPTGFAATSGMVVDEMTGMAAPWIGTFTFPALPAGPHRFKAHVTDGLSSWVAGPLSIVLTQSDQQAFKLLAPLAARPVAGSGRLRFRIQSVGASVDPASVTIAGLPVPATPDSRGDVDVTLPEGGYTVSLSGPALDPPPQSSGVVLAGQVAELGTLYFVSPAAAAAAQLDCAADADCAPGTCAGGACQNWTAPAGASAATPFCSGCNATGSCSPIGAVNAVCTTTQQRAQVCAPCGGCCTPDGVLTVCGPAGC